MPEPHYSPPTTDANGGLYAVAAAAIVADLAPAPDPETEDYIEAAEVAEFLVYNHLKLTGGASVTSKSARGLSASFTDIEKVKALVAPVMGDYFTGTTVGAGSNTAYVEDFA